MATSQNKLSQRGENMKLRITDAALNLFANQGFDAVSISDIAAEVGMTQPNIHYYFSTKEALWKAAVHRLSELAQRSTKNVVNPMLLEGMDPLSALKVLSASLHNVSREVPELGKIIVLEGIAGGDRLQWLVETIFEPSYERYTDLIQQCVQEKLIKPYPAHQILFLLHSAAVFYYNLSPLIRQTFDADPMNEDVSNDYCDLYLDVVFSGLSIKGD